MRRSILFLAFAALGVAPPALADDVFAAARRGDLFAVKHYLEKDAANLGAVDHYGFTALDWAATRAEWEVVAHLVAAGAGVDRIGMDGGTVLHRACHHGRPDMVRLLIDAGADVSASNQWGRTPLHVAARRGHDLVCSLLLRSGADIGARTKEGWTALHVAERAGQPRVAAFLVEAGADPDARDAAGKTPAEVRKARPKRRASAAEALDEFEGYYEVAPHFGFRISLEGDRLRIVEFAPDLLYPIGPDEFFCEEEPWRVTFLRDDDGAVARVKVDFLRRSVLGERQPIYEYVGSARCAECHAQAPHGGPYVQWLRGRHAGAYWTLATDWARFLARRRAKYRDIEDPQEEWRCLKCHVTGAQDEHARFAGSFREAEGVGCEACHGPGSAYIEPAVMADHEAFLASGGRLPTEATCRQCHQDESFVFAERLPRVRHPASPAISPEHH